MRKIKLILTCIVLCLLCCLSGCISSNTKNIIELSYDESVYSDDMQVYCFSAGKADAFLITTPNSAVLIDTGEKNMGKKISKYLKQKDIETLDYLIITHFDKDHVGGAAKIIDSVNVDNIVQTPRTESSEEYINYKTAISASNATVTTVNGAVSFVLDNVTYYITSPQSDRYRVDDDNNSSLITSVINGKNKLLFLADAQDFRLEEFIETNKLTYDFIKFPYHGNWQESLTSLLDCVNTSYTVITSSDKEPENDKTIDLLNDYGVQTFLTRQAPVIINSDGQNITVRYDE